MKVLLACVAIKALNYKIISNNHNDHNSNDNSNL